MKKKIGELLLQIIPVMIGVYLGFVVSDWAENAKNQSKIELFKENIFADIESNRSRIENVLEYQAMLREWF